GTYLGAASSLTASDLTLDMFDGYTYLFIEGYLVQDHEMILRAIELAKEAELRICLDMASYNIVENDLEFFTMLIQKYVDIVFAIVKVGAKGSFIKKGTEEVRVLALPIKKVIDTTGAGDYFAAGFLYGLTCGYSLEKCAAIGSLLSGNVIQVVGTTMPKKQWNEIKLNISALLSE
ncbi:MAG: adenosine kinase, partial [Bacteroides sp.]